MRLGAGALDDLRRSARAAYDRADDERLDRACRDIFKREPEDAEARRLLGRAALRDVRPRDAEPWFREAAARAPDAPGAWTDLARALVDQRRDAEAGAILSAAAARGVRSANLMAQLGFLQGALNDQDAARQSFETALDLDPGFAEAYRGLGWAGGLRDGAPDRRAAERVRATLKPGSACAVAIDFAVGDADLQDGREAGFDRVAAANAAQYEAAGKPKDPNLAVFRRGAPTAPLTPPAIETAHAPTLVFVLGAPGAGLELVEAILAAHPRVFGADQLNVAGGPALRAIQTAAGKPNHAAAALLDAPDSALRAGAEAYFERITPLANGAAVVVDAQAEGLSAAPLLAAMAPSARFIFARREAMDAGWATWRTPWTPVSATACDLAAYGKYARRARAFEDGLAKWLGDRALVLDVERLAAEPEPSVAALLRWLDLEPDAACARVAGRGWSQALSRPRAAGRAVSRDVAGAWRPWAERLHPLRRALRELGPNRD